MRVWLWIQQRHELPCASRKFQGIRCAMIGGEVRGGGETLGGGDVDKEVSLVDGVLEGALGALGLGNESSSGGHGCVWLLMMSKGDGELVLYIWRELMGRDLIENGMNLNKFRVFQIVFKHSGQI
ncbi:hypothetical protein Tco_0215305 [Tanacetum coccineum]